MGAAAAAVDASAELVRHFRRRGGCTLLALLLGPALCLGISLSSFYPDDTRARRMLGIVAWVASWWVSEVIPLPATALLPFVLQPLLGILSSNEAAAAYLNDASMLFLGNFLLAQAVEHHNLHRRIALKILSLVGTKPRMLLLGFIASAAFLSMWISNTATSVMMVPMAIGVLDTIRHTSSSAPPAPPADGGGESDPFGVDEDGRGEAGDGAIQERLLEEGADGNAIELAERDGAGAAPPAPARGGDAGLKSGDADLESLAIAARRTPAEEATDEFSIGMVLGIAYACSIGGLATITGTGPNIILNGYWTRCHGQDGVVQPNFLTWFLLGFPLVAVFILILWLLMGFMYTRKMRMDHLNTAVIEREMKNLPPMSWAERVICCDFVVTVLLWLTRSTQAGGWGDLFDKATAPKDGTVSIVSAVVLFIIPSRDPKLRGTRILDWEIAKGLPWDIVLILGGGFSMSAGIARSGLLDWLGQKLSSLNSMPLWLVPTFIASLVTAITEFTSNVATSTIILPLLDGIARSAALPFQLLLLPATIACSLAFCLPNATPPNAVAYSSGYLTVPQMIKPGFILNVIGVLLASFFCLTLAPLIFDFPLRHVHDQEGACY